MNETFKKEIVLADTERSDQTQKIAKTCRINFLTRLMLEIAKKRRLDYKISMPNEFIKMRPLFFKILYSSV